MKELTNYISWLSQAVLTIAQDGYNYWLTSYSDQPYFERANDRIIFDAQTTDPPSIDDWADLRISCDIFYETQTVPPEYEDIYYHAAERARPDGLIRKRMAFRRPPCQGLEGPGGPTARQRLVRKSFKSAIDTFAQLPYADRQNIYDRAISSGLWYFNFFIEGCLQMIKSVQRRSGTLPATSYLEVTLSNPVDTGKSFCILHGSSPVLIGGNPYSLDLMYGFIDVDKVRIKPIYATMVTDVFIGIDVIEFY